MRALISTINADHPQLGVTRAFHQLLGAGNVVEFDYLEDQRRGFSIDDVNMRFMREATNWEPHWIWLQVQDTNVLQATTLELIRKKLPRSLITHWTGDLRTSVSPYLASICKATDMTFASSIGQLRMFLNAGASHARYLQIGLDWDEDVLGLPAWTPPFEVSDVVFIGNRYPNSFPEGTRQRLGDLQALRDAGIDVGVVGTGWGGTGLRQLGTCGVKQQHHVWKRAKVGISINHFNEIQNYYSDRQLISMASGTPVVCRHVPGLEREFEHGRHCLFYKDQDELVRHVRKLLDDPREAKCMGWEGRSYVMQHHTWWNRLVSVLPEIESRLEEKW